MSLHDSMRSELDASGTDMQAAEARAGDALPPTARMLRVLQVLKKALDVSVSHASTVDLRAFFEDECREEPELLHQLFAPATEPHASREQHAAVAGELGAQALQSLRQRIDAAFRELAERHGVNAKLAALEQAIEDAQRLKMKELASEQIEEKSSPPTQAAAATSESESDALTSPQEVIRAERIRVMEAEKKQLDALLRQLQMEKEERATRLSIKRELAMNAIEDLQHVSSHLQQVTTYAQDYAT
ncbi:hypothetical protein P43SY_007275 [Pythium insidiosum]|uniref:Uncharacterized protein n=1 Tax=Pythium insidiosum TaxID=114742 RepID=A0AAD5L9J8_PYTIN|nr:hypothetical protein P43SY_007275 [Pythium insidiosum]